MNAEFIWFASNKFFSQFVSVAKYCWSMLIWPNDGSLFSYALFNNGRHRFPPMARPFIKWAGGKRQLLEELIKSLPDNLKNAPPFNYAEPFVGGGALMFKLFELNFIDKAVICDYNPELVLVYKCIKHQCEELITELNVLQDKYNSLDKEERREMYFEIRSKFNESAEGIVHESPNSKWPKRASEFIFLNKTGFNGLYRVNKKGRFNVPPSNMGNKDFLQAENLRNVSRVLAHVTILQGDYQSCLNHLVEGSFVYFDPPYRPLKKTSFTTYSSHSWAEDSEQIRLAHFCHILGKNGVSIMQSNSDPTSLDQTDTFFQDHYSSDDGFFIRKVVAIRAINSSGSGRGKINELLITNY